MDLHFYSHASCEARLHDSINVVLVSSLISTHTPLARRDDTLFLSTEYGNISTHTPLARRDIITRRMKRVNKNFYSHASCEARPFSFCDSGIVRNFYSHASCEARQVHSRIPGTIHDFYSHASCEARQTGMGGVHAPGYFYSHASCEARLVFFYHCPQTRLFLLTRLLRGATIL